jgi:transcriptional regulator with GAF, ATPase, and Fis domain
MVAWFKRFDLRISIVYAIVATLWIILSDHLLRVVSSDANLMALNTWKGLGFVAVTTVALFLVISRELRQRNQVEEAEREQSRLAEALRDTLFALTASVDVDQVMQQILDSAATVVSSEAGSIVVFEGNQGRIAYTRGFPPESQAHIHEHRFTNQNPQSADAFGNSKPYLIADTRLDPNWIPLPFTQWIRSSIGVPIELRGRIIGVLIADSLEPNHFRQADVEKLTSFARYTALALENAYHITRLEQEVSQRTS